MAKEIEVKILDINLDEMVKKLLDLGATKVFDDDFHVDLFDNSAKDINLHNKVLRIRTSSKKSILTYKKIEFVDGVKSADEYELEVEPMTMKGILEGLGYKIFSTNEKHRVSYVIGTVHFDFDTYKGEYSFIPTFLEIEAESKEEISKYVKLLSLDESKVKPWGFNKLKEHYEKVLPKRL